MNVHLFEILFGNTKPAREPVRIILQKAGRITIRRIVLHNGDEITTFIKGDKHDRQNDGLGKRRA